MIWFCALVVMPNTRISLSTRAKIIRLDWITINGRLCTVRLDGIMRVNISRWKILFLFVVSVCASTDGSSAAARSKFYQNLSIILVHSCGLSSCFRLSSVLFTASLWSHQHETQSSCKADSRMIMVEFNSRIIVITKCPESELLLGAD